VSSAERRVVLWASLAAAALVVVHSVLWDMVRWDGQSFMSDNTQLVIIGARKASLFRASLLCDAIGSYLLTLPATLALRRFLRTKYDASIVDLLALGGVIYAIAGAVAAVVWADAGAQLIRDFATATGNFGAAPATDFAVLARGAIATWQIVCVLAAGAWWLGSGLILRDRWKWFARYSIVFGALSLVLGAIKVAGADFESSGPATAAFLPIAIWIGWLGVELARDPR
jgi:hypothetical protein